MASPKLEVFFLFNLSTGLPLTGQLSSLAFDTYKDTGGVNLPQPFFIEIGGGAYGFAPVFTDPTKGIVYIVNCGTNANPARVTRFMRPEDWTTDALPTDPASDTSVTSAAAGIRGLDARDLTQLAGSAFNPATDNLHEIRANEGGGSGGLTPEEHTALMAVDGRLPVEPAEQPTVLDIQMTVNKFRAVQFIATPSGLKVTGAAGMTNNTVKVSYSNYVRQVSPTNPDDALNPSNYTIYDINLHPLAVVSVATVNGQEVMLSTAGQSGGMQYNVLVQNVRDISGNLIDP